MALVVYDRVQETTATTGTGTITLGGAVAGYQTFAVVGNGNTTFYCIVNGSAWEVGIGTYSTTGPTLARTTVLSNSSGTTSPITLSGASNVFVTYPSEKSVNLDSSGNVSALGTIASGIWQGSTIQTAYGGTGVTTSTGVSSNVLRDANSNITGNNFLAGYSAVTAAGGTTVLTAASAYYQRLSGSTTQTFQLPDATTCVLGQAWVFDNDSSGTLTIVDNASGAVDTVPSGGYGYIFAESISTSAGSWGKYALLPASYDFSTTSANFGGAVISNTTYQGTAVASGYGGTGLTTFSAANNALYSTSSSALAAGTLPVAAGGTAATTFTSNGVLYGNGTSALGVTAAGTTGQVLIATTSGAPSWGSVPSSGAVTSFSAGTTGFTPSSATTGAVTLAGTLNVANGGTGVATLTGLAYGNGTGAFTAATAAQVVSTISTTAVTNATNATNTGITEDTATVSAVYPTWVTANTGNLPQKTTSTKLTFVPSTGVLSATSFTGAGTGLTGTAASLSIGGNAATATTATNQSGGTVAATTISASGVITSTVATGTAPFTVSSTTAVANLSIGGNAATATTATTATTANALNTANNYQVNSLGIGTSSTTAGQLKATTAIITPGTTGVSTGLTVVNGDITTYRSGGTTGVIYLSSSGSNYLYFDGTNYNLGSNVALSAGNYNSYAPTLTGTGASGTWGINVTGSSGSTTTATNVSGGTVSATTISATGGYTATSAAPFYLNATTVSSNYTSPANYNLMSAGPITINTGVTVTIDTTGTWVIV